MEHPILSSLTIPNLDWLPAHADLRVRALFNFWDFVDLIEYRGGSDTFYDLHREMAEENCKSNALNMSEPPTVLDRQRIFLIPRDHRKSSVLNVPYIMWRHYRNPDLRILLACNVVELAKAFVSEIRSYYEDEELQVKVWNNRPHISGPMIPSLLSRQDNYAKKRRGIRSQSTPKESFLEDDSTDGILSDFDEGLRKRVWTNFKLQLNRRLKAKEPSLCAVSVNQRKVGHHYDLVLFEDIVDDFNSSSEDKSRQVCSWVDSVTSVLSKKSVPVRIAPGLIEYVGAERIVIGTSYYPWDWYNRLIQPPVLPEEIRGHAPSLVKALEEHARSKGYRLMHRSVFKNRVDKEEGYLCPEIYDEEVDAFVRSNISDESVYWSQYHNLVSSSSLSGLRSDYRVVPQSCYSGTGSGFVSYFERRELNEYTQSPAKYEIRLHMLVDLASSLSKSADRSAVLIGGKDSKHQLHLVDGFTGRVTPSQLCEKIVEMAEVWGLTRVSFESGVGYQGTFKYTLSDYIRHGKHPPLFIEEMGTVRGATKKQRIVNTLQPLIESQRLIVSDKVNSGTSLKEEVSSFGRVTGKDDLLDLIQMLATRTSAPQKSIRGGTGRTLSYRAYDPVFGGLLP